MNEKFGKVLFAARQAASRAGGAAAGVVSGLSRKTGDLAESARLRFRAAVLEGEVEERLEEVGGLLYATHTGSPTDSDVLQKKLEEIDALQAQLAEINGKLGRETVRTCPACGAKSRPGDVFCHMYQGQGDTILGPDGRVKPELWEARRRGVLFDACNGNANFSFRVAEPAMEQGFLPDLIGSDLTPMSFHRPFVHDLPRLLSKYLMLGMKLEDVLQRVTLAPARQLGRVEELATLHAGTPADVALFRLAEQPVTFRDRDGESRTGSQVLLPQMTVKDGAIAWAQTGFN